jgi:hypothetical protein
VVYRERAIGHRMPTVNAPRPVAYHPQTSGEKCGLAWVGPPGLVIEGVNVFLTGMDTAILGDIAASAESAAKAMAENGAWHSVACPVFRPIPFIP